MNVMVPKSRLSLLKAAWVVARRDFVAILFSRVFFFFLLGPLFPIIVGSLAGGIGSAVERSSGEPEIGIAMSAPDVAAMMRAEVALKPVLGGGLPRMRVLERLEPGRTFDAKAYLDRRSGNLAAIVTGTLHQPRITATEGMIDYLRGDVAMLAGTALKQAPSTFPEVEAVKVATSGATEKRALLRTAQAGQLVLFLLIMMLAGMVLSNLVEEKANKIIEILAAAIPMDALFLGKLFAMLAVSLVGVAVWGTLIGGLLALSDAHPSFPMLATFQNLPTPGVGWPLFFLFGVLYFSTGYLLLGSIFLSIGSMATTVREVQTMSMPVTMSQVLLFLFAGYAMAHPGEPVEIVAIAFPLSSPFAMFARAAQDSAIWPHLLALAWQIFWVLVAVRIGARLFRSRVMKSGPQRVKKRGLFRKTARGAVELAGQVPI